MMMTVTATPTTTITATTPPTVAALLSGSGASVVVLSDVALWITKCVDGYGTAAVHIQSQTLYSNGGVCLGNKSSQNAINCELVTWALP